MSTSSGSCKAWATAAATMTPPRGNPRTNSASTPSSLRCWASLLPASSRDANIIITNRPVKRKDQRKRDVSGGRIRREGWKLLGPENFSFSLHFLYRFLDGANVKPQRNPSQENPNPKKI